MYDEPHDGRPRALRWRVALLVAFALGPTLGPDALVEASTTKPHSTRKIYDLTPPRPGELLANPVKGSGSPPQLKEFTPTAAMHLAQDEAGAASSGASGSQSSQGFAGFGPSASGPRAMAAGPPVRESNLQVQLTDEITRFGIEGFLARPPQAGSTQELQYWEAVRREVAASLATWQTLYAPAAAPKDAGPQASPTPPAPPSPAPGPKP